MQQVCTMGKRHRKNNSSSSSNPSRISFRILQRRKLNSAAAAEALAASASIEDKRLKALEVCRTVEAVDQDTDNWRDDKTKILFMLGLGLTPVEISQVDAQRVLQITENGWKKFEDYTKLLRPVTFKETLILSPSAEEKEKEIEGTYMKGTKV